jgi:beta-hydroxylase
MQVEGDISASIPRASPGPSWLAPRGQVGYRRRSLPDLLIDMPKPQHLTVNAKLFRTIAIRLAVYVPIAWLFPSFALFYLVCGLYDVARNSQLDGYTVYQYFFGRGLFTWMLSPFNIIMDIVSLPYWNKGVYRLEDLPPAHQAEVRDLIAAMKQQGLVEKIQSRLSDGAREMIFFKWYGQNIDGPIDIPEFRQHYPLIRTIGVSVFNRKKSTNRHFGPLRMTLRVLYNLNDVQSDQAWIEVGRHANVWRDEKMFIFDDTLMHQSFNETEAPRYCAFIDVVRPGLVPTLMGRLVDALGGVLIRANHIFYKNWSFIK